ncbi:hypothetical protein GOODEAATRI_027311 [Goodea atripinnis]|uniref:Secreted protein n=1 Tax=Goodea atripinnis TaxID=208336 RepID=A0ABV0PS45_9TELE
MLLTNLTLFMCIIVYNCAFYFIAILLYRKHHRACAEHITELVGKKVLGSTPGRGSFCMEFACSSRACAGSHRVLQLPSTPAMDWPPTHRLLEMGTSFPPTHYGRSGRK